MDIKPIKTDAGLVQWCPEKVLRQLRFDNCPVDLVEITQSTVRLDN